MASIRQKGPHQWQVQIRRKGWPVQSATLRSKKDALAFARKTEREMDQGIFIDQSMGSETTLGELIDLYLKGVTANRPSQDARQSESSRLKRFKRKEKRLCSYAVINLSPDHFEDYRDRRKAARLKNGKLIAPSTVNKELMQLKRVIDYRKRRLGIIINPVNTEDVQRLPVNDERDVRLSPEQRNKLLNACDDLRNPLIRAIVEMGFETGARRGNLLRLEWSDIDLDKGTALLRGIKNSRTPEKVINHEIGLTPRAIQMLQELPQTSKRVFPLTANAFRKCFNRARKNADLEHFRFHDTRHERVSSLFEAGWSMIQVMAQSAHRDPKSVKRYANISGKHLASELAKI